VLTAAAIRPDYRSGRSYRHIVISGGKIRALADTAAQAARAAGSPACWVDLGSACVGPGFIDTHIHALQAAADVRLVSLRQAATLGDLLAAVREAALSRPSGEWTVSRRNWHESQLREGRLPTRAELDALGATGPILVRRGSHLAVLNSLAVARLDADGGGPGPGAAAATGHVHSDAVITRALELAVGKPTPQDRCEDLATVMARLAARGLTSIREAGVDAPELELFRALREHGRLPLRCDLMWRIAEGSDLDSAISQIADMPSGNPAQDPYLRLTGVKAFVDGRIADAAIGGKTGREYACDQPFRVSPADLRVIVEASLRRAGGIGCHAVGDAAVRLVLDAYERALAAGWARDPRQLVIEHALNCAPETIQRLAAAGVSVSAHPGIVYEFADDIRRYWGEQNAARAAPVRDMVSAGVAVAAGSDGDVPPFDPLRGIWFMVTRTGRTGGLIGDGQAVARHVAFDLYTRCGAALLGVQARRGVLRPGLDADLVAFSADPLSCPVDELPDTEILLTLVEGRAVYDPGRLMEGACPLWMIRRSWSTVMSSTPAAPACTVISTSWSGTA
jgi:predicted amidohydrolase YtcJ